MLGGTILGLALLLLVVAVVLRWRAGLPWGRVAAMDVGVGRPLERPLVATRYGLVGKPDYLIERGGAMVPVEVKPGRRAPHPYDSDLMQLAAYCLLVEETTGHTPPCGYLRYANATFRLSYTPAVRRRWWPCSPRCTRSSTPTTSPVVTTIRAAALVAASARSVTTHSSSEGRNPTPSPGADVA